MAREDDGSAGIRGNSNLEEKPIRFYSPTAADSAADGIVMATSPTDSSARPWPNSEVLPSRLCVIGVETGEIPPHPFPHRPEGPVIKGVHARVLETAAFDKAIPAFPDGGSAVVEHIEPGGECAIGNELPCDVFMTPTAQFQQGAVSGLDTS